MSTQANTTDLYEDLEAFEPDTLDDIIEQVDALQGYQGHTAE